MKSILIVDDEADLRELIAQYLKALDYEVVSADSGKTALKILGDRSFDLFILDLAMPKMNGDVLLREIRKLGIQTPALFLTAHDTLDDKTAVFEAGADDFLAKPFSPRELEFRVSAILRRTSHA